MPALKVKFQDSKKQNALHIGRVILNYNTNLPSFIVSVLVDRLFYYCTILTDFHRHYLCCSQSF